MGDPKRLLDFSNLTEPIDPVSDQVTKALMSAPYKALANSSSAAMSVRLTAPRVAVIQPLLWNS